MVGPFSLLYLSARVWANGKVEEKRIKGLKLRSSEGVGFDKTWFTKKGPTRVFSVELGSGLGPLSQPFIILRQGPRLRSAD